MSYYDYDYFKYIKKLWFLASSAGVNMDYDEEDLCPLLLTGEVDENAKWKQYDVEAERAAPDTLSICFKNGVEWIASYHMFENSLDVLWKTSYCERPEQKRKCTCGAYKIKDFSHSSWCDLALEGE